MKFSDLLSAAGSLFAGSSLKTWAYGAAGVLLLGALTAAGTGLYRAGENAVQVKWDGEKLADADATLARIAGAQAITFNAGLDAAKALDEIHVQVVTLIKEIPAHVSPAVDARYPLPVGLVRMWNASALGVDVSSVPLAPGQSDDSPSGTKASDLAGRFTEDNGNHRACVTTLKAVLDAWQKLHALGQRP